MSTITRNRLLFSLGCSILVVIIFFQFWGIQFVPFHPDESTQLYMSDDFQHFIQSPWDLAWMKEKPADNKQIYRLLDAPLTRYLIGFGLWAEGQNYPQVDWDWSKSWEENKLSGAYPEEKLLIGARMVTTSLLPLTMFFLFLTGIAIGGHLTGFLSGVFLGLNALVLLHGRRVMAESALLMSVSLCLLGMMKGDKKPWLAGIGAALAFNSKQSAVALLPVSLLSVLWLAEKREKAARQRLINSLIFIAIFVIGFMLLNPFSWKDPLNSIKTAWKMRRELVSRQVVEALPEEVGDSQQSLGTRSMVVVANLFITPPSFAEVGNYQAQTDSSARKYLGIFPHRLGRGLIGGGVLLALTISGTLLGFIRFKTADKTWRREFFLLVLAMFSQFAFLVIWVLLPWQRYAMPLVPFVCLWSAFAIHSMIKAPGSKK